MLMQETRACVEEAHAARVERRRPLPACLGLRTLGKQARLRIDRLGARSGDPANGNGNLERRPAHPEASKVATPEYGQYEGQTRDIP